MSCPIAVTFQYNSLRQAKWRCSEILMDFCKKSVCPIAVTFQYHAQLRLFVIHRQSSAPPPRRSGRQNRDVVSTSQMHQEPGRCFVFLHHRNAETPSEFRLSLDLQTPSRFLQVATQNTARTHAHTSNKFFNQTYSSYVKSNFIIIIIIIINTISL